nr:hypothetical protein [uncultured bacterium]
MSARLAAHVPPPEDHSIALLTSGMNGSADFVAGSMEARRPGPLCARTDVEADAEIREYRDPRTEALSPWVPGRWVLSPWVLGRWVLGRWVRESAGARGLGRVGVSARGLGGVAVSAWLGLGPVEVSVRLGWAALR